MGHWGQEEWDSLALSLERLSFQLELPVPIVCDLAAEGLLVYDRGVLVEGRVNARYPLVLLLSLGQSLRLQYQVSPEFVDLQTAANSAFEGNIIEVLKFILSGELCAHAVKAWSFCLSDLYLIRTDLSEHFDE